MDKAFIAKQKTDDSAADGIKRPPEEELFRRKKTAQPGMGDDWQAASLRKF